MFSKHVTKSLSAYYQNELSTIDAQRVKEHLDHCLVCQKEFEEIKRGIKLAEQLPIALAPSSLWTAINKESDITKKTTASFVFGKYSLSAGAIILLVFCVYKVEQFRNEKTSNAAEKRWEVARLTGAPQIGSTRIQNKGELPVGEWLETDNNSSAHVKVAEIGYIDIDPNSRLRLVQSKQTEHRVNLERGKLSAFIVAPPRLFFVDTPSATAVDLGCAYTLEVDEYGTSLLHVTAGWVSLVLNDRKSSIPAGAMCATRKGVGVGTPYYADASPEFKTALTTLDFGTSAQYLEAVDSIIYHSRMKDALTLWHLLNRKFDSQAVEIRGRLFDRLAELIPPPSGVTRNGAINGDYKMLDDWWDSKIH